MELAFTTIQDVQKLVDIVEKSKLDYLKIGEIEIRKTIHLNPPDVISKAMSQQTTDDELFWSSGQAAQQQPRI